MGGGVGGTFSSIRNKKEKHIYAASWEQTELILNKKGGKYTFAKGFSFRSVQVYEHKRNLSFDFSVPTSTFFLLFLLSQFFTQIAYSNDWTL